ncbi:MAG: hypothetical protein RR330_03480 [Alistipes sp.]
MKRMTHIHHREWQKGLTASYVPNYRCEIGRAVYVDTSAPYDVKIDRTAMTAML